MKVRLGRRFGYPDRISDWWREVVLGEDAFGRWGGIVPMTDWFVSNGNIVRHRFPIVFCYPHDGWWTALFMPETERIAEDHRVEAPFRLMRPEENVYVHMSTPPLVREDEVSFVDLILDVTRRPDGGVEVLDEDEVDELQARWSIPADHITHARRACAEVERMLRERIEPFGDVGPAWLAGFTAGAPQAERVFP